MGEGPYQVLALCLMLLQDGLAPRMLRRERRLPVVKHLHHLRRLAPRVPGGRAAGVADSATADDSPEVMDLYEGGKQGPARVAHERRVLDGRQGIGEGGATFGQASSCEIGLVAGEKSRYVRGSQGDGREGPGAEALLAVKQPLYDDGEYSFRRTERREKLGPTMVRRADSARITWLGVGLGT